MHLLSTPLAQALAIIVTLLPSTTAFVNNASIRNVAKISAIKQQNQQQQPLFASITSDSMTSLPDSSNPYADQSTINAGNAKAVDDVKVGVLLLNLGGPEKTQDVEGKMEGGTVLN